MKQNSSKKIEMGDYRHEHVYEHWNPLIRYYFYRILDESIKLSDVSNKDRILDFGAGECFLKKRMKNHWKLKVNYFAFDKKFLDRPEPYVNDYSLCKPDIMFALSVLEHLDKHELHVLCEKLKTMKIKKLITSISTGNRLSRVCSWLVGFREIKKETHVTPEIKDIYLILEKYFTLDKEISVLSMNKLGRWFLKK